MSNPPIERAKMLGFWAGLIVISLLLRISYAGHLFQDDGLWFTAAEQILRGKALYSEIYFDKPPVLPLVYAALFKIFGAHIVTIRLFTIFYSVATSVVLYLFGSRLFDRRAGMLAAVLFTFFSTTPVNNHTQGLNTDFLMLLPYTLGAYLLVRACFEQRGWLALLGGGMAGIAVQTNPKGICDLILFVLLLFIGCFRYPGKTSQLIHLNFGFATAMRLLVLAIAGLVAGALPFLVYVATTHSFSDYWLLVWDWGVRYSMYHPMIRLLTRGARFTLTFLGRNNTLLFGLVFVLAVTARRAFRYLDRSIPRRDAADQEAPGDLAAQVAFRSDVTLLLWLAVSYAGVAVGGRFYSNYFFQILPSLCLIGARGLTGIISALNSKPAIFRRAAIAVIAICFVITAVRFHTRTAQLAVDWIRGTGSGMNARWHHEKINREDRQVAAVVRDLPDGADHLELIQVETLRYDRPRGATPRGPSDCLFVWGSRDEIYYWSGLLPASRYLSAQPLTGIPSDTQHSDDKMQSILNETATAAARAQLIRELEIARPKYVVDEIGFVNAALSIQAYPELREFMGHYTSIGPTGRSLIYRLKEELDSTAARATRSE